MTGIQWIVVVPVAMAGAVALWWLSRNTPKGVLIAIGVALHVVGRFLSPIFPAVEDGYTGERFGSFLQRSLPDVCLVLQILGTIAVVHGVVLLFKRKDSR